MAVNFEAIHKVDGLLPSRCLLCGARGEHGLDVRAACALELRRNAVCCARCAAVERGVGAIRLCVAAGSAGSALQVRRRSCREPLAVRAVIRSPARDRTAAGNRAGAAVSRAPARAATTRRWNWPSRWRKRCAFRCCAMRCDAPVKPMPSPNSPRSSVAATCEARSPCISRAHRPHMSWCGTMYSPPARRWPNARGC